MVRQQLLALDLDLRPIHVCTGNAANFVETEQILSLDDSSSSGGQLTLASYVEVRAEVDHLLAHGHTSPGILVLCDLRH